MENKVKFCTRCGSRVGLEDKFCTVCGQPQEPTPIAQEVVPQQPVQEVVAQEPVFDAVQEEVVNESAPQAVQEDVVTVMLTEEPVLQDAPAAQEVPQTMPVQEPMPQFVPQQEQVPTPPVQPILTPPVPQPMPMPQPSAPVQKEKKPFPKWAFGVIGGVVAVIIAVILILSLVCFHEWRPATCTMPETCIECGETRGSEIDHDWSTATCEKPKTCRMCGDTKGEPLAHTPGSEETENNYVTATATITKKCTECGETVETREQEITKLYNSAGFCFTPMTFTERFGAMLDSIEGNTLTATCVSEGSLVICSIRRGGNEVGYIGFFINDDEALSNGDENEMGIRTIFLTTTNGGTADDFTYMYIALLLSCDPTITVTQASENVRNIFDSGASKNGIDYFGMLSDGDYCMSASLD